ncbi:Ig-like domain-containing protein [Flavivirga spongiicola]|uniref:Ig-like domain-containing protein n=1 Tax=Flavivirga spongiicola TaxID=421621 RepID=A0ABU7XZU5_9FLAO|nr:Ig-like domain-containing protein [Flavivirga sp. MEBiC05379]MDO5980491.1 Ig-like domain-containing protein [Flavivirga sp. MEBiC05379]
MEFFLKPTAKACLTMFIISLLMLFSTLSCNNEEIFASEAIIPEDEEVNTPEDEDDSQITLVNDEFTTIEDTSTPIALFTNDVISFDNVIFTYVEPDNGSLDVDNNQTPDNPIDDIISYIPNTGFEGTDTFEYTICDTETQQTCDTATVTITVTPKQSIDDDFAGELKAFPSAYGAGAYSTGGRGGNVYHVTNLNDSGPGSFSWAVNQPRPATVVFDVSGIIKLQTWLTISGSDLTIAGQTAPEGGITLTYEPSVRLRMAASDNIVIRYLRFRPYHSGNDAFEIFSDNNEATNIVLDHISGSYGGDETMSIRGRDTHNITFQRLLIAESKTGSLFGDSDSNSPNNSYDNSIHNCLYFNVSHRTPNAASSGRIDIINNISHDWHYRMTYLQHGTRTNHINNYGSAGARKSLYTSNRTNPGHQVNAANSAHGHQIYTAGNIIDKGFFTDPNADNRVLWAEYNGGFQNVGLLPNSQFTSVQHPLLGAPLPIKSARDAYNDIIKNVGANAFLNADGSVGYYTDTQDTFYLNIMNQGEGAFHPYEMYDQVRSWTSESMYLNFIAGINSNPINTRPTGYDTDGDGMPNVWETMYGTNPDVPDNNDDKDGDGYTNLEEFLNSVDKNQ